MWDCTRYLVFLLWFHIMLRFVPQWSSWFSFSQVILPPPRVQSHGVHCLAVSCFILVTLLSCVWYWVESTAGRPVSLSPGASWIKKSDTNTCRVKNQELVGSPEWGDLMIRDQKHLGCSRTVNNQKRHHAYFKTWALTILLGADCMKEETSENIMSLLRFKNKTKASQWQRWSLLGTHFFFPLKKRTTLTLPSLNLWTQIKLWKLLRIRTQPVNTNCHHFILTNCIYRAPS